MALSDLEIAQSATLQPIAKLAKERLGIGDEHLESFGHYKAKLSLNFIDSLKDRPNAGGRRENHHHGWPGRRAESHFKEDADLPA
jgi:hypothetical protein